MNQFPVELRVAFSKKFPPGVSEVRFGAYLLNAIPSDIAEGGEAILRFRNSYSHPEGGGSHPEEEATNVCRVLSLLLNARYRKVGFRLNHLDIPTIHRHKQHPQFLGQLDTSCLEDDIKHVLSLEENLARQFVRASHTYSFALDFIPSDITFAFFLLVVSVECLSSQNAVISSKELDPDRKKAERFVKFIESHLPHDVRGPDERNAQLFKELLRTIYYSHRSGFVHGGKEVSSAALMADKAGSSYFKHEVDGKETKTPGIGWFAGIARGALVGYLRSQPLDPQSYDSQLLAKLAFEKAGLRLKAKRAIEQHTVVTLDDVEYR
jgi:hypothetical protein